MMALRFLRFGATAALAATLVVSGGAVGAASSAGVVKASPRVVAQMVKDMGTTQPAKCQAAELARSDRSWAAFSLANPLPSRCSAYDGYSIVHRVNGTWKSLAIGGSYVPCPDFKKAMKKAGAPSSVYRDFKAGGYCIPGA